MTIAPVEPPDLIPLRLSHEADAVEADLKQMVIDLFGQSLRPTERAVNVYGMPHLGPFDLIERIVNSDGLGLYRREDEAAMRYLFKAWRARNPRRGLTFLRTYLQLLWPNEHECEQLWQSKADPYPTNLVSRDEIAAANPDATHYLTCRVRVAINELDEVGEGLRRVLPSLHAVVPARFVLLISVNRDFESIGANSVAMSNGGSCGIHAFFEGYARLPQ